MATRFTLTRRRHLPGVVSATRDFWTNLPAAEGLVGYSLGFSIMKGTLMTLSAWTDLDALRSFVHGPAHTSLVATTRPWMEHSTFANWTAPADAIPPRYNDAIARLKCNEQAKG